MKHTRIAYVKGQQDSGRFYGQWQPSEVSLSLPEQAGFSISLALAHWLGAARGGVAMDRLLAGQPHPPCLEASGHVPMAVTVTF